MYWPPVGFCSGDTNCDAKHPVCASPIYGRNAGSLIGQLVQDYCARYYHPGVGRFISPDTLIPNPANPQSLNRYAYVHNNPLKYTDPTGHWVETAIDIISLGLTINDIRREGFTTGKRTVNGPPGPSAAPACQQRCCRPTGHRDRKRPVPALSHPAGSRPPPAASPPRPLPLGTRRCRC